MPVEQITQVWPPLNEFRDMYDNSTPSDFGNPADTTQQRTILTAWRDYYLGALAKVPEMTLPFVPLTSEVAAAQAPVNRKAEAVLASLKGR